MQISAKQKIPQENVDEIGDTSCKSQLLIIFQCLSLAHKSCLQIWGEKISLYLAHLLTEPSVCPEEGLC